MVSRQYFEEVFNESMRCSKKFIASHADVLEQVSQELISAFRNGNKLLLFGNGGSAADAQHIAAEFVNRLTLNRAALPALALTTDSSVLTSIANDFEYNQIFARQVEALGQPGDIAWGMSTSGNSKNVLAALELARNQKLITLASLGNKGGKILDLVDYSMIVDSCSAQRIQEVHITLAHAICQRVEEGLFLT